jgi:hypothetical protein
LDALIAILHVPVLAAFVADRQLIKNLLYLFRIDIKAMWFATSRINPDDPHRLIMNPPILDLERVHA